MNYGKNAHVVVRLTPSSVDTVFREFLTVEKGRTLMIDGAGRTLHVSSTGYSSTFEVKTGGKLCLYNIHLTRGKSNTVGRIIFNSGTLDIGWATLTESDIFTDRPANAAEMPTVTAERVLFRGRGNSNTPQGTVTLSQFNTASFTDCVFDQNRAKYGAAVDSSSDGMLSFIRCTFSNNEATLLGGAVRLITAGHTKFTECLFVNCSAGYYGGAVHADKASRLTFEHCTFSRNIAAGGGHHLFVVSTTEAVKCHDCGFDSHMTSDSSTSDGEQVMLEMITTMADFDGCRFQSPKDGNNSVLLRTNSPWHELELRNTSMHLLNGALLDVRNHILGVTACTFKGLNGIVKVAQGTDAEVLVSTFNGVRFVFPAIEQDSKVQFRNNINASVTVVEGSLRQCDAAHTGLPAG